MLKNWNWESLVTKAWHMLVERTRRYSDNFPRKLKAMQDIYLRKNANLYTKSEEKELRYYLDVVLYKFLLVDLSLEQLWALSMAKRSELLQALENSLDRLDCSDDEQLLMSFALECALFESSAFLDVFMLYTCLLLKASPIVYMTKSKFYRSLKGIKAAPFAEKAAGVKTYFDTKVFGDPKQPAGFADPNWGDLVISLRDKIAHRDRLRPSFDGDERLLDKVLLDWPTLRGLTYERFIQSVQSGMWLLAGQDLAPVLYDLEWKPGPYKPHLWQ